MILGDLMDVVSKNGALLLNVGPRPDGSFEPEEVDLLHRIGDWLGTNGEAVYGSTPWTVSGEGPTAVDDSFLSDEHRVDFTAADLRFTRRGDIIYAAALRWPADGELLIRSLVGDPEIARVELLGSPDPLPLRQLPTRPGRRSAAGRPRLDPSRSPDHAGGARPRCPPPRSPELSRDEPDGAGSPG